MKRYIRTAPVIFFAALALAGCSKTEELQYNPDSALQIESVSGISPFALTTKAVITGNTLPDSEAATGIGIFVTASDGGAYDGHANGYTNVNFANSGSGWSTATPVYLSDTEGKLYGYFPYSGIANDLRAIPVVSSLNGTDYLYAEPQTVSHSNKTVSLTMNHALSCLHLTIKKGANFTAEAPLSKITLNSTAIDATGTMDITTGTVTAAKGADETGTVELPTDGTITAEGIEKDILLVPADNSESKKDISISLLIDGKSAGITLSGANGLDIRSGIQNNITLTIEDTGVKVTGIGVGEWGEVDSQEVQVDGHKVTVKFSSNTEDIGIADDVLTAIKVDGSNVMIEAYSKSQKRRIGCYLDGVASCKTRTDIIFQFKSFADGEINLISYIFTISDISSDITATIGYPRPEKIELFESYITYAGYPLKFNAAVLPDDAVNKNFTWSSSNPSVATVDANGRVSPNVVGTANITATTEVGGITATCTVTVKSAEELILSGEFSVGHADVCKKVRFSRGNLRYTSNPESWCFFDNQYEQGHGQNQISLFTWGYGSWSTVWDTKAYQYGYFTDWGKQVGDGNTWRTLSRDGWYYLLEKRAAAATKIGYATVCGMHGLLLLPDEFEDPKTNESNSFACVEKKFVPKLSAGWEQNIYSQGDSWNKMQAAGALFLPAAGYRGGSDVDCVGDDGCYWSSTTDREGNAYSVNFRRGSAEPVNEVTRNNGYSVRLVTDVK